MSIRIQTGFPLVWLDLVASTWSRACAPCFWGRFFWNSSLEKDPPQVVEGVGRLQYWKILVVFNPWVLDFQLLLFFVLDLNVFNPWGLVWEFSVFWRFSKIFRTVSADCDSLICPAVDFVLIWRAACRLHTVGWRLHTGFENPASKTPCNIGHLF